MAGCPLASHSPFRGRSCSMASIHRGSKGEATPFAIAGFAAEHVVDEEDLAPARGPVTGEPARCRLSQELEMASASITRCSTSQYLSCGGVPSWSRLELTQ